MKTYTANWSGCWPCLCSGEWSLVQEENGVQKDLSKLIPTELIHCEMNTFGEYETWYFDENFIEEWETYEDGLQEEEWIKTNEYWLSKLVNKEDYPAIFKAFQASDWRHSSCGGCI